MKQSSYLFNKEEKGRQWVKFSAQGFSQPVTGVIHRRSFAATCGLPLGGIDTGCIDLETSGIFGYSSIFNCIVPRRRLNMPFLGLATEEKTWVLTTKEIKGVQNAREIHYWGHYPVVDLEYETDAPISVGLRAYSPFIPGDVATSNTPGAIFQIHLRNTSKELQKGTVVFSFPGPNGKEMYGEEPQRQRIRDENMCGMAVTSPDEIGYLLGVVGKEEPRFGGGCGADGAAWAKIRTALPAGRDNSGALAVDFGLRPGERKIVRVILAWYSRQWNGAGRPALGRPGLGADYHYLVWYSARPHWRGKGTWMPGGNLYTHMYAARFNSVVDVARYLARSHESLLPRILSWQQAIYTSKEIPGWLQDSLINILHLITEDSLWAQAKSPIGNWCRPEDGLFGMIEDPRGCPQVENLPSSFYGNLALVYLFPELALSTLRGYKAYMFPDGQAPWVFGGHSTPACEMVMPTPGYQTTTNGPSFVAMVYRYWQRTEDEAVLREFYPSVKRNTLFTMDLVPESEYGSDAVIRVPSGYQGLDWFENYRYYGMAVHVGGIHLANLKMAESMAEKMDDKEFAERCRDWFRKGSSSMENRMWTGKYYLNYYDPETGRKSDHIFAYQLDGEWMVRSHGLASVFEPERIKTTLATIKRTCVAATEYGAVNFADPDGSPTKDLARSDHGSDEWCGTYSFFPPEVLMLAMTFMYHGNIDSGLELARRCWQNIVLRQGRTWNQPNLIRGDTGEQTFGEDYYQNMMLWFLPAALQSKDLSAVCSRGQLVDRIIRAGRLSE